MGNVIAGRLAFAASLVVTFPGLGFGQQRMAPLPPDCTVPGSSPVAALARTAQQASLAVLPLNIGTGAGPLMYLSDALPGGIANRIALSVPRIYVVGRRVQRRRRPATPAEFHALSSELGVRYALDGGITGAQGSTQIFLALYEVTSGRQVWHRTFSVDSAGALPVEQSAAIEIASRIGGALSAGEKQRLRLVPTAHHVAYDLALRGDASEDRQQVFFAKGLALYDIGLQLIRGNDTGAGQSSLQQYFSHERFPLAQHLRRVRQD